jgi:hypothetical protein
VEEGTLGSPSKLNQLYNPRQWATSLSFRGLKP